MAPPTLVTVLQYLRTSFAATELEPLTDGTLLERFLAERDEAAFAVLVHRHGAMVLGVCQRVLGDGHHAEDAFQATFLVLVRRAAAIRREAPLGPWLYGVAQRVAVKARARAAARNSRQRELTDMPSTEPLDDRTWQELRPVLDEEVGRLPEKCRTPIVLCYFEGKSYDQAAQELGWPKSSLASRLARGRDLLRHRLVKRGIVLSAGVLTTALAEKAAGASVAALLTSNTAIAAARVVAGTTVAEGVLSAQALALAEEALTGMIGFKRRLAILLLALSLAVGLACYAIWGEQPPPPSVSAPKDTHSPDPLGGPLPAGAVARMGQNRWLHDMIARFAAFLPDGKSVVTVTDDRIVRVWEFPSGKEIRRFDLPGPDHFYYGAFPHAIVTRDGKTIATWVTSEPQIYLHDLATGKQLQCLKVPNVFAKRKTTSDSKTTFGILTMAFSPDGKHLATCAGDNTIRIWAWATGREVHSFGHGDGKAAVQRRGLIYTPDGMLISTSQITASRPKFGSRGEGVIELWDPTAGTVNDTIPTQGISSFAMSPDGNLLALHTLSAVTLVEVATRKERGKLVIPPLHGQVGLLFGKDGSKLYATSYGGEVMEWDIGTHKLLRTYATPGLGPSGERCSLSPAGNTLVLCGRGPIFLDLSSGKDITPLPHYRSPLLLVRFAPDGKTVITQCGNFTGVFRFRQTWDADTGKELSRVSEPADFRGFSPDGKYLLSARLKSNDGRKGPRKDYETVLIDVAKGKDCDQFGLASTHGTMRFSPDSQLLAIPRANRKDGKGKIELYEIRTGKIRHTLSGNSPAMIFSADSKLLAVAAEPNSLDLWDTTSGQRIGSLPMPKTIPIEEQVGGKPARVNPVVSGAFSPDGRCLALELDDGRAVVYELATSQPRYTFGPHPLKDRLIYTHTFSRFRDACARVAFAPDGRSFAYAGHDHVVHVWDTLTGKELAAYQGHAEAINAIAFSPNGKRLASASEDSTALIWDVSRFQWPALPARALSPGDFEKNWQALAEKDAAAAFAAIRTLTAAPPQAVALIKKRVKPAAPGDPPNQTAEMILQGDMLRSYRAVEILERIGTPQARAVLRLLAAGAPGARLTRSAQAALQQ